MTRIQGQAAFQMHITVDTLGDHLTFGNIIDITSYIIAFVPNAPCNSCFSGEKLAQEGWGLPPASITASLVLTEFS